MSETVNGTKLVEDVQLGPGGPAGWPLDKVPLIRTAVDHRFSERMGAVLGPKMDRGELPLGWDQGFALALRLGCEQLEREEADPALRVRRLERETLEALEREDARRDAEDRVNDILARRQAEEQARIEAEEQALAKAQAAEERRRLAEERRRIQAVEEAKRMLAEARAAREGRLAELRAATDPQDSIQ